MLACLLGRPAGTFGVSSRRFGKVAQLLGPGAFSFCLDAPLLRCGPHRVAMTARLLRSRARNLGVRSRDFGKAAQLLGLGASSFCCDASLFRRALHGFCGSQGSLALSTRRFDGVDDRSLPLRRASIWFASHE